MIDGYYTYLVVVSTFITSGNRHKRERTKASKCSELALRLLLLSVHVGGRSPRHVDVPNIDPRIHPSSVYTVDPLPSRHQTRGSKRSLVVVGGKLLGWTRVALLLHWEPAVVVPGAGITRT